MAPTALTPAEVQIAVARLKNMNLPVWMLDWNDTLTDIRAIMGGTLVPVSAHKGVLMNLFSPFVFQGEDEDARFLAEALAVLGRLDQPLDMDTLQGYVAAYLAEGTVDGTYQGGSLQGLLMFLSSVTDPGGTCATLVQAIATRLEDNLAVLHLLGESNDIRKGLVRQYAYEPSSAMLHEAVTLALYRLADLASQQRGIPVTLVTLRSPHDTPGLAALTWERSTGHLHHLRVG